jgi:hypothetical protein
VAITLTGSDPNTPPLSLTYVVTAGPAHGALTGTAPDLTYTPTAGYFGPDSFQYTVSNGVASSGPATVTIVVIGPPTAASQSLTTAFDTAHAITLTGSDPNTPPLSLTYVVTAGPAHGALTGTAPNLIYTPAAGYSGPDSFQFEVNNGSLDSNVATVSITVAAQSSPSSDGPRIISVKRYGYHTMPTTLVLAFDQPLDPTTAEDVKNYVILGPDGRRIGIGRAVYDPAGRTVTLHPGQRISIHHPYGMTVKGTGSKGLRSTAGQLLDGADAGQPSSDFRLKLTWRQLVLGDVSRGFLIKYHIRSRHPRSATRAGHVAAPTEPLPHG